MNALLTLTITCAITSMSAHAGIIYSGPMNQTLTNNWHDNVTSVQNIAGAQFEFGLALDPPPTAPPPHWAYFAPISNDAAVFMSNTSSFFVHNFSEGEIIDRPDEYLRGPMTGGGADEYWFSVWNYYGYANAEIYTGFVVGSGDDRKVGWAHMVFDVSFSGVVGTTLNSATLKGWAYNDVPGGSIMAGQTEATAIPGAGGLVALACGAAGLRRRRNRATTRTTTETA